MPGIYIHIPFCHIKCSYCDFYSISSTAYLKPILSCFDKELCEKKDFLPSKTLDTIYIGGGTPSTLSPKQIAHIFDTISKYWDLSSLREVTLEVNPDDITPEYLREIKRSTPINRLSMGVQSFDDDILRFMNRRHDAAGAERAFYDAREAGFRNISLDLMYGVPSMSETQWQNSLKKMLELSPEHISAYHLSIEPRTRFGMMLQKGELKAVDELISQKHYDMLCSELSAGGYEHYEISNFAKPSFRAVHNSSYWSGEPYLGIGAGAHSFDGAKRHWCEQSMKEYIAGTEYQSELLSETDKYNEFIMLSLRCKDGVNLAVMEQKFGKTAVEKFLIEAEPLREQALVVLQGGFLAISEENWLISDTIMAKFFV